MFAWMFLLLIVAHFIGDYYLQSHWVAQNKSKSWLVLTWHCTAYSGTLLGIMGLFSLIFGLAVDLPKFAVLIFAMHFAQDAITSRINSRLYVLEDKHAFFVSVGFDQMLHYMSIFLALYLVGLRP